jgi:hypothetical protein
MMIVARSGAVTSRTGPSSPPCAVPECEAMLKLEARSRRRAEHVRVQAARCFAAVPGSPPYPSETPAFPRHFAPSRPAKLTLWYRFGQRVGPPGASSGSMTSPSHHAGGSRMAGRKGGARQALKSPWRCPLHVQSGGAAPVLAHRPVCIGAPLNRDLCVAAIRRARPAAMPA